MAEEFDLYLIYKAIYDLTLEANTVLPKCVYEKLKNYPDIAHEILQNAYLAYENARPLCQDCGQVVVFLKIGQNVRFKNDKFINDVINNAIKDAYQKNFYRKSVVDDAISRKNTETNTPAIIYTEFKCGDSIEITLGLKGAGAENMTQLKMFNPNTKMDEICDFIKKVAQDADENACPPMSLGVGIGGTSEYCAFLAKKALFEGEKLNIEIENVFETKILTAQTHIACMPVCVNVNCHSHRFAKCEIRIGQKGKYEIFYKNERYEPENISENLITTENLKEINTNEIEKIKNLNVGDKILLTGTIYTARDAAHARLCDLIAQKKDLPFDLNNAIIFYAGPCPRAQGEIIGPIGPTTAKRMDKFAPILYEKGVLATIGKGNRAINQGIYFKAKGGVACLLQNCVKKSEIIAFQELGTEAIYKLEIEKFPLVLATI